MKAFAAVTAAALCITSPISVAAQTSGQCYADCAEVSRQYDERCAQQPTRLDQEYCELDRQSTVSQCYSQCDENGDYVTSLGLDAYRLRPELPEVEQSRAA